MHDNRLVCYRNTADGEICYQQLLHQKDDVGSFYAQFKGVR